MATLREVRNRIRSVKNIAQVTRAMQAVSASKLRKAQQAVANTQPYAAKAWQVLTHVSGQPGHTSLHPLLAVRPVVRNVLVVLVSSDRGLAGAYNTNIVRFGLQRFKDFPAPVSYIAVGRKGRDMLIRRKQTVIAEFGNKSAAPTFSEVSAIGRLVVDDFLQGLADQVFLVYTDFVSMVRQVPTVKQLLPLEVDTGEKRVLTFGKASKGPAASYIYEPSEVEILDEIVPRFTALQVYQAILEASASEHAARMISMQNATDNATDLAANLTLDYNKARQQSITSEMLDIVGGAEAQAKGNR